MDESMNPKPLAAPADVIHDYMTVLERAILELRMRIRYSYEVTNEEVHDLMDALHNIPQMLRNYSGWHLEENIDADLTRYDEKWVPHGDDDGAQAANGDSS
jgi:hypothetical protein